MANNVRAFLDTIAACEGATYTTLFGGGQFVPGNDHPRIKVTASGYTSTAAGRYQILAGTWDSFIKSRNAPPGTVFPFNEAGQDACAIWLIDRRGALQDVQAGRLRDAIAKCGKEWASLPGSPYGQPVRSYAYCEQKYLEAGGQLFVASGGGTQSAPVTVDIPYTQPAAPIEDHSTILPQPTRQPMGAALTLLPLLAQFIPQIMTLIKPGSQSTAKDAAVAQTILNTVVQAAGVVSNGPATAQSVGAAVDAMQADPALAASVQKAVVTHPDVMPMLGIVEVGAGGIKQAREDSASMQNAPKSFWWNPAFWITALLLAMPFMLLADVFYVHPENYTDTNLKTQIVTGVLAVIMVVSGFWLGSSQGSQKKDDALAAK